MKHNITFNSVAAMLFIAIAAVILTHLGIDQQIQMLAANFADPSTGLLVAGLGNMVMVRSSKHMREMQQDKTKQLEIAQGINQKAASENRDLTDDEEKQFNAAMQEVNRLNAAMERESEILAAKADDSDNYSRLPHISVQEKGPKDDEKAGFHSFGEFLSSVYKAAPKNGNPGVFDQRLNFKAAAPGIVSQENIGESGGFMVPPGFSTEVWRYSLGENSLVPMTQNTEITGNSMMFPKDETTPWGGSGVQAFWRNEGPALTGSQIKLGSEMLRLHELTVLVPVTNELLEDAAGLGSYIMNVAPERIMWKTNEAILFGSGSGQPLGAFSGDAAIVVAGESGQLTNTINQLNISKMRSRCIPGGMRNSIWIANPDTGPQLESIVVGNWPAFLPIESGLREDFDGRLFGRPLLYSEHANALSSQGDINLVNLKGYRTITKAGGIETATSMHIYFDANATAFRFIFRIDGKPLISQPVTPPKSTNKRSYFISLGARTG